MVSRNDYYAYIQAGYQLDSARVEQEIGDWQKLYSQDNSLLGYMAPKFPLQVAAVAGFLYENTAETSYAHHTRDLLLRYQQFTEYYPANALQNRPEYSDGVPPLDAVFDPLVFAHACKRIWDKISAEEQFSLAEIAASSLRPIWRFPEWGGHNRAMLRAASLASCASVFHQHPQASAWNELADELAEESWGRWSIEDTMMYQAHWLRAMIVYAGARNKAGLTDFIQPRMYLNAIVQLLSPLGILPDFGDSHWLMHSHWEWLALLEWGAASYRDPAMKWAADQIWQLQKEEPPNIYGALVLTLAYSWSDDKVLAARPQDNSDALDDMIMKKLVFRTGWERDASYACINYRDEGDFARVARDYLRTNLAVSAEKMHHGHSDEGSFAMLVHDNTLLLHESGYREQPPDGIYRADVYHNRVVWRNGMRLAGIGCWDFLKDQGHYHPVRTDRLYQTRLWDLDIRRVRIHDELNGVIWDRTVIFLPSPACWFVIDSLFSNRSQPRTFSALWWTTELIEYQDSLFRTHIEGIQSWQNNRNAALWIVMPKVPGQKTELSQERVRRSFQEEMLIANTWSGDHRMGNSVNFASVLLPQPYQSTLAAGDFSVSVLPSEPAGRTLGLKLRVGQEEVFVAVLNDLTSSWLQEDIRPRYSAEQGWYKVGPVSSDSAFVILRNVSGSSTGGKYQKAGILNGTRLEYEGEEVFQMKPNSMFQEDRSIRPGVTARFRWTGEI